MGRKLVNWQNKGAGENLVKIVTTVYITNFIFALFLYEKRGDDLGNLVPLEFE